MRSLAFCCLLFVLLASLGSSLELDASVKRSTRAYGSTALRQILRSLPQRARGAAFSDSKLEDCGPLCVLDLPGIIAYNGYPVESHPVQSIDGQLTLNMYRIPCGRNFSACTEPRPAVLLQHGLLDSGTTWVINPPNESLGFILADAGYDVWIGNNRGNSYSPCTTDECWKFSYDEMAMYDLPTFVNYILSVTNMSSISYVGHSEGTTQAFAGFSLSPELASKVNLFVALAPAILVNHQESPLLTLLVDLHVDALFELFGVKDFMPSDWFIKAVGALFCNGGLFTPICDDIIFALCGVDPEKNHNFNQSRTEVYVSHTPAGTSVQNMAHWAQAVRSSQFQMFDYGTAGNIAHYGQQTPPLYDLSNLTVPTALFSGGNDYLADPEDVEQLMNMFPKSAQIFSQYVEEYNHLDFAWGVDCAQKIYPNIVSLLQKYAVSH